MNKRTRSSTSLTLVSIAIGISMLITTFPMAAAEPAPGYRIGTVQIGGITWTDDIRVTRNAAADTRPQITVDAQHNAHIMWVSQRSQGNGYWYVSLNRLGEFLSPETFISNKVLAGWGPMYPLGPTIDIDSMNNLHIVYDDGWQNVKYMKFDEQGNILIPEKQVGPNDSSASHTPSIAVGTDDTIHISHEEYRFQCEDIAYDKLDNNGNDIWIDRVVSSDVASHCEFDLIKADRFSGSFMFTFGSATGTWLGRYNKFGVKDIASVKIRTQTDLKIVDVAATPNGMMHTAWTDGGKVLYSAVNSTGVKIVTDFQISSSGSQTPGFPRIAAASDGRVVIVWDDARYGNKEIMIAIIEPGWSGWTSGSPTAVENIRLTTAGGDSTEPWVAIDPDDNFHVAWVDNRDNNQEIYYKFAFNFALELYADPIDLSNMFFIHPNETKRLPMFLKNKGGLPDGYNLDLQYTPGADALGWRVSLDKSFVENLESEEITPINLTVRAPAAARDGDNISVAVNASSISAPGEFDALQFPIYVKVTRGVKLTVDQQTKYGDNGQTLAFNLNIKNTGDVREDKIELRWVEGTGPAGWAVSLDKQQVALDPQTATNFTVFVTIPMDAPGLVPAIFAVMAWSAADPTATDRLPLTVAVKAAFILQMKAIPPQQSIDPGKVATYTIEVANVGNLPGNVQINLEAQNPTAPGWTAALDREVIYLRGGDVTQLTLTVRVPDNAVADTRITLVVHGLAPTYGTEGQVEATTFVNRIQGLDFEVSSAAPARVGRPVSYTLTITNTGNGDETLQLQQYALPSSDWTMEFLEGPATVSSVFVPHGQSKNVDVRVTVGLGALAGTHYPTLAAIDVSGGPHYVRLTTVVQQFFSVSLTATEFKLQGSPGMTLEYNLQVMNAGNGPDNFTLSTENLPSNFQTVFYKVDIDPLTGEETRAPIESGVLSVSPKITQTVKLLVTVPLSTTATNVEFSAHATSQAGEEDPVILVAEIKKADLGFGVLTFTPSEPKPGQITAITIEVQNTGEIGAGPIVVVFEDNGQEIAREELVRVASGAKGYVTFAWLPTAGEHTLRFIVDPLQGPDDLTGIVVESNEDNNAKTIQKPVVASQNWLPGFEAPMVFAGLAAVLVIASLRRRRDE